MFSSWLEKTLPDFTIPFVVPVLLFLASFAALLTLRIALLRVGQKASGPRSKELSQNVANIFRTPSLFWSLAIALHVAIGKLGLSDEVTKDIKIFLQVVVILSVCLAGSNALETLIHHTLTAMNSALVVSGLIRGLVRSVVFAVGTLVIFSRIGIHIGPMLTALGVGGLAVGLALQDTLGNLLAGINLLIDRSLAVGDRIKVVSGQEGLLLDIGWRTSKIRLDEGDLLIIPNTKLAQEVTVRREKRP